jgi:hypothetical protein
MGIFAYNLLQILREFCLKGEEVKRSVERLIPRLVKAVLDILAQPVLVGACGLVFSFGPPPSCSVWPG